MKKRRFKTFSFFKFCFQNWKYKNSETLFIDNIEINNIVNVAVKYIQFGFNFLENSTEFLKQNASIKPANSNKTLSFK